MQYFFFHTHTQTHSPIFELLLCQDSESLSTCQRWDLQQEENEEELCVCVCVRKGMGGMERDGEEMLISHMMGGSILLSLEVACVRGDSQ